MRVDSGKFCYYYDLIIVLTGGYIHIYTSLMICKVMMKKKKGAL